MTTLIQLPQVLVLLNKKLLRLHFNLGLEHSRKLNIERPENTQLKSFRSWESVHRPRPLSKVVPHSLRALCEDR